MKLKDSSQPLKAELSFNRYTPTENGELGAEVSKIIFLHGESYCNIGTREIKRTQQYKVQYCDTVSVTRNEDFVTYAL